MTRFELGDPLPRAADAYVEDRKWTDWILAPRGHGVDWFRMVGRIDADDLWRAIVDAVEDAPIVNVRVTDRGITCGLQMTLPLSGRQVATRTAWHYDEPGAAPRLLSAYPAT